MDNFLKLVFISFVLLYLTSFHMSQQLSGSKFTKTFCNASEMGSSKDVFCSISSSGALNVEFTITRKLLSFDVVILTYIRRNGAFKEILKKPKVEWCNFVDGSKMDPFRKILQIYLKKNAPRLISNCPIFGKYYGKNLTLEFFSIIPSGEYKVTYRLYDKIDNNILGFSFYGVLDTSLKL